MDILSIFQIMNTLFYGVLGLVIGSFLNVCIYRIPGGRTIVKGHSMCMSCGHELGAPDLIPLFSWLILRGKCRYCGSPIASRYAKIEGLTGLVFAGLAWQRRASFYLPGAPLGDLIKFISLFILLSLASIMITAMMIQKDHGKGMYRFSIGVFALFLSRLFLCVLDPSTLRPILISAAAGLLTSLAALSVIIVITVFQRQPLPQKQPRPSGSADEGKTKSLAAYFASENRAIRPTDVLFLAAAVSLGFPQVILCLCIYPVCRIIQMTGKQDKLLSYMGIVLAASALLGVIFIPGLIF